MTVDNMTPLLEFNMNAVGENYAVSKSIEVKKNDNSKFPYSGDIIQGGELWTDGLICAFEFIHGYHKMQSTKAPIEVKNKKAVQGEQNNTLPRNTSRTCFQGSSFQTECGVGNLAAVEDHQWVQDYQSQHFLGREDLPKSYWMPIGWARISELVKTVSVQAGWASQPCGLTDDISGVTVADLATPYWERPVGPTWWCHLDASHPFTNAWLGSSQWLHPAISVALRDESRLISERMKHLLYEVPVRVAGGLIFELLGQSAGDPFVEEDDIPIVLRSWQAQNFLVTALYVKGSTSNINVLGIAEVQELLAAGGTNVPRCIHEVVAHLACHLARWDDSV